MKDQERCTQVRVFTINDKYFYLYLDLTNDSVFVTTSDRVPIGLEFTSSSDIVFKGVNKGVIRLSFDYDDKNLKLLLIDDNGSTTKVDTKINQNRSECYIDAEVFTTKYLIENKIIDIGNI